MLLPTKESRVTGSNLGSGKYLIVLSFMMEGVLFFFFQASFTPSMMKLMSLVTSRSSPNESMDRVKIIPKSTTDIISQYYDHSPRRLRVEAMEGEGQLISSELVLFSWHGSEQDLNSGRLTHMRGFSMICKLLPLTVSA